jgi:hypothetical protein
VCGCPDAIIQLICRWASPESLAVYRRIGVQHHAEWTAKASGADFEAVQSTRLPELDAQEGHAAANAADIARALAVVGAGQQAPLAQPAVTDVFPPRQTPGAWTAGDVAMVPRSVWPDYQCREFGGRGWLVRVLRVASSERPPHASVRFLHARARDGRRFEDSLLQLSVLTDPPETPH